MYILPERWETSEKVTASDANIKFNIGNVTADWVRQVLFRGAYVNREFRCYRPLVERNGLSEEK